MAFNSSNFDLANITSVDDVGGEVLLEAPSNVTMSIEEFLEKNLGPKHLALNVVIPITVVYVLIFVSGVIGNVSVCMVIIKNSSMHTATNYYLFSLAVSDLTILSLGLPNDLNAYWQQYPWVLGEAFCKIRALVAEMTSYSSVLTIVAFSTERYLAICHPLLAYSMSGLRRALRIIAVLWVVSLMAALPYAVFTSVHYVRYPNESGEPLAESAFCAMLDESRPPNWPLHEISTFVFFIIPMGIILFLYIQMGLRIRQSSAYLHGARGQIGSIHGETKQNQSKKAIIRMLTAVVMAFFVCWAPFHAQRLFYVYAKHSSFYREINEIMYYITGCLLYFSSTVNPILYNLMSKKYREAFKETLCGSVAAAETSSYRESGQWHRERPFSASYKLMRQTDARCHTWTGPPPSLIMNKDINPGGRPVSFWRPNSRGNLNIIPSRGQDNNKDFESECILCVKSKKEDGDFSPDSTTAVDLTEIFDHRLQRQPFITNYKSESEVSEINTSVPSVNNVVEVENRNMPDHDQVFKNSAVINGNIYKISNVQENGKIQLKTVCLEDTDTLNNSENCHVYNMPKFENETEV